MSRTDSHRPEWVRLNDNRGDVVVSHSYRCHGTGGAACDLPAWPVDKHGRNTLCFYRPAGELWQRIYGDTYASPPSRQPFRRAWFGSERTAQRRIARILVREANSGGQVDEDVIDDRQTHRYGTYGGGWWD